MTAKELRKCRDRLEISQAKLGEALRVSGNTVARWERDELPIPPFLDLALETIERRHGKPSKAKAKK